MIKQLVSNNLIFAWKLKVLNGPLHFKDVVIAEPLIKVY